MNVIKLQNNNLIVPKRAEAKGIIGDGVEEITPEHPDYELWLPFVTEDRSLPQNR